MFWANFIAASAFWGIALAGGLYWGRRYVRALEARAGADARIAELETRLAAIEADRAAELRLGGSAAPMLISRAPASDRQRDSPSGPTARG